ncbi:SUMF1/EgtB/PvdO family nonheme iron enzyme [Engelhardtia mirabilis]|uniref:Iron(II)-dependent oxidoreductase EgtB n=1 Tax=Engelhardtia mirabilis TaxID=2528011 RepID=A0A518BHV5_9BACT|nr:Iron(II)-dependent oxidoreductase EgtB [Planctomycetes bacterium Pla133]QDV00888.1 Iron(II)-dependent oxidoreductase EgtB [Planctomycetes bacterium Pla86]
MDALRERLRRELAAARRRTLELVEATSAADLARRADAALGPGIWDLGHLASFEDLWGVRRVLGESERVSAPELDELYDAFEQPRSKRCDLPLLDRDGALELLERVRARTLEGLERARLTDGDDLVRSGYVWSMLVQHEAQHQETLLQSLQHLGVAIPTADPMAGEPRAEQAPAVDDEQRIQLPGAEVVIGGQTEWGPYDNERPRHAVELAPFALDRYPLTNRRFLAFVEAGCYARSELWTAEGRSWLARCGARSPAGWTRNDDGRWSVRRFGRQIAVDPREPVQHISCHEAEAFATWVGARLPTEFEWEHAATAGGARAPYPWGTPQIDEARANCDGRRDGPAPVGSFPRGASPLGIEQMLGDVHEWTASSFDGYRGFEPFPYPEYSQVFFDRGYRVLRGSSWAAAGALARVTYRNWDLPERRQIFAGCRLAWDA